jgi:hypothetical protein
METENEGHGRTERIGATRVGFSVCVLVFAAILTAPAALGVPPPAKRVRQNWAIDRATIETLQRWVSSGHEDWCRDARMVASYELERIAPDFRVERSELIALPLERDGATGAKRIFTWTPSDGRATYRVTVERFLWLMPIARRRDAIVWVPTRTEIILAQE